jgi:hypothetical protein
MQRGNDGLAFAADNVRRVVLVLIVRFHHIEDHRLRLIAGGAPNSGEASLQVASYCGIACHVERPVDRQSGHDWQVKENPAGGEAGGHFVSADFLGLIPGSTSARPPGDGTNRAAPNYPEGGPIGASSMWKVGNVEPGGVLGVDGYPYGFDVTTQDDKRVVSFAYTTRAAADVPGTRLGPRCSRVALERG